MKERDLTAQVIKQLPSLLPPGFTLIGIQGESSGLVKHDSYDIEANILTPKGVVNVLIDVKNTDRIAPMREAALQVKQFTKTINAIPFVAGIFLGDRMREALKEEGVGYLDLAGNFYLNRDDFYAEKIVNKNPFSSTPPLKNLFAPTSSRITRAILIEPERTWHLSELARETGVSLGQSSSVIEKMIAQEFLFWNTKGKIELKDPATLLEAWKEVYPTYRQQRFSFFSFERSYNAILSAILEKGRGKVPFAFGFFTGAGFVAPFIRGLAKAQFYVENKEDVEKLQTILNLQLVESGPNVELFIPYDKGVFYKQQAVSSSQLGDVPVVSNVQLYMDLFNNPSRGEEQAEHLRERKLGY